MRTNEITIEKLRYRFSPEEHLKNAELLATKLDEATEMKKDHDAVKADLKEQEKRVDSEIGRYTRLVRDMFEMRDVQCKWEYGRPLATQKTLVRLDTNEDCRVVLMLDHERQEQLNLQMPSHVMAGPGSLKGMRIIEMPQSDIDYFASRDEEDLLKFGWLKEDIAAVWEEARRRAGEPVTEAIPATPAESDAPVVNTDPEEPSAPIEVSNTLPSTLAMAGGTTAAVKRGRGRPRRDAALPTPTAAEREALDAQADAEHEDVPDDPELNPELEEGQELPSSLAEYLSEDDDVEF